MHTTGRGIGGIAQKVLLMAIGGAIACVPRASIQRLCAAAVGHDVFSSMSASLWVPGLRHIEWRAVQNGPRVRAISSSPPLQTGGTGARASAHAGVAFDFRDFRRELDSPRAIA